MKPSLPTVLDSTMMVDFRSCYERFRNRYMLNLAGRDRSVDLIAGGAIAAALEAVRVQFYLHKRPLEQCLIEGYKAFTKEWGPFVPPETSNKQFTNSWLAVEQYFQQWPLASDELQPLRTTDGRPYVEFSFAIPVGIDHPETGEPFIYVGRFDLLGEWMKRIVVSDEKTMGQMSDNWVYQWGLRNQFMGYCWGAQQYGYQCNDALIRGICLLKYETKMAQAPAHYPDWMLARWHEQLLRDIQRMIGYWREDTRDYNFGSACTEYGGCTYRDLCVSAKPEVWYSHFNRARWNPIQRCHDPVEPPEVPLALAEGVK